MYKNTADKQKKHGMIFIPWYTMESVYRCNPNQDKTQ